jgi:hypothetical protein
MQIRARLVNRFRIPFILHLFTSLARLVQGKNKKPSHFPITTRFLYYNAYLVHFIQYHAAIA